MSADQVRMMCPNLLCRKVLAVPENCRGKTVRCRSCGTNIRVPTKATSANNAPKENKDNKDSKGGKAA